MATKKPIKRRQQDRAAAVSGRPGREQKGLTIMHRWNTIIVAACLTVAAALGTTVQAETVYREFYDMTEDQQGEIISGAAQILTAEAEAAGQDARRECINALFASSLFNPLQGRLPEGWNTLINVVAYERRNMQTYDHGQSVEDAIRKISELYCTPLKS